VQHKIDSDDRPARQAHLNGKQLMAMA
jgi:hypothetical protein